MLSLLLGVTLYSQDNLSILKPNSAVVRIAYINRDSIISLIPQVGTIEKELLKLEDDYKAEFVKMTKEYEGKVKSYLERNKQMSEPIKLARQTEITELEEKIENLTKDNVRYTKIIDKYLD